MIFQLKIRGILAIKQKNPPAAGSHVVWVYTNLVTEKPVVRLCLPFSGRVQPGGSYGFSGI